MQNNANPKLIPSHEKKKYLASFVEDDFRDKVIRPIYQLTGFELGKDTCGPDEEGKDCYFWYSDPIRKRILYAVQTKRGDLKLSSKLRDNVTSAEAQMRTALNTKVSDALTKTRVQPSCVVLAASGVINKAAREYICDQIPDPRLTFQDAEDLIPMIDELMPEFWNGIDAKRIPYLRALREYVIERSATIDISEIGIDSESPSPITDDHFVELYFHRYRRKTAKKKGAKTSKLDMEELTLDKLLDLRENFLLITGDAGSGKSTSLYRACLTMCEKAMRSDADDAVPILLTASRVVETDESLASLSGIASKEVTKSQSTAFSAEDLESGRVAIFIDGLDEIADNDNRRTVFERVMSFHERYKHCKVVIASRDYKFLNDLTANVPVSRFRISPISFRQAEKMISRLARGKALSKEQTQETLRRLENIHGLKLNPLLVTVFVATTEYSRTDIPANITELFKKFTEVMLGRWGRSKGVSQQFHVPLKDFLLQQVAFHIHARQETSISEREFCRIVEEELESRGHETDVQLLTDELLYRSGLLRVIDGQVLFAHMLIQEFFAGRAIPSQEYLGKIVSDVWWTKATVFYFGENPGDSHGLSALRDGLDDVIGADEFQAAVTVGLASQACYLMKSSDKIVSYQWVIEKLSECCDEVVSGISEAFKDLRLLPMLHYYIYGRDAVAGRLINEVADEVWKKWLATDKPSQELDVSVFWCVAGLIESRHLDQALEICKKFKPSDDRLLLALHLGAYYVQELHVTSKGDKRKAKEITKYLDRKIDYLRPQVLEEMNGLLLEVRGDKVEAIE